LLRLTEEKPHSAKRSPVASSASPNSSSESRMTSMTRASEEIQVSVESERSASARQTGEVAFALFQRQVELVGRVVADGAVGGGAHHRVDVELAAVGLGLEPAPTGGERRELAVQPASGAAQVLGQRARCGARVVRGGGQLEQADVVLAQQALAVVPFRQRDALAEHDVVLGCRGQVEVEAHLGRDPLAVAGDGELLEVGRGVGGVVVGGVVGTALDLDELRDGQQALGPERDDHAVLLGRVVLALDAVGLLAAVAAGFAVAGFAGRTAVGRAGESALVGAAEVAQPQQYRLGRPGLGGQGGEGGDAARGMQGLAQQAFAFGLGGRQLVELGALRDHRVDQVAVAGLDAGPALQRAQGGALVRPQLGGGGIVEAAGGQGCQGGIGGRVGLGVPGAVAGGECGQPQVEVAVEGALGQRVDLRRQAQRGDVHAAAGDTLVGAGDALQQAAAGTVGVGGGGGDAQAGIAAQRPEEHAGDLLDLLELDCRLGEMPAGSAGDQAVPEQAYGFFHGPSDP